MSSRLSCLALLAAVLLTACAPEPEDPVRVVAVSAATAEQVQPDLGTLGAAAVRAAAESDRGLFTLLVAGASPVTDELVARRERGAQDAVEHGPRRAELVDGLVDAAALRVSSIAQGVGEPDLLQAIADGARGTPGTLLVLDSGVSTTDPLDLRALGWAADPAVVAEDLRARDALPELRGWDVVFVGLGRVAGDQPLLGLPQQRWLERLWIALCTAAQARSCTVDAAPIATVAQQSTRRAPAVGIPLTETLQLSDGTVEITLPDARLGFAPGSAEIAPEAGADLQPIVDAFTPGAAVRVTGVVAFWGDEGYRQRLSQDRADAVSRWLVSHGIPAHSVLCIGAGAVDGPDASTTNGRFDERKVAENGIRRVVVNLSHKRSPNA